MLTNFSRCIHSSHINKNAVSKKPTKKSIFKAYRKGYKQQDPKRVEAYAQITNDLSEGLEIGNRLSKKSLAEVIGYLLGVIETDRAKVVSDRLKDLNEALKRQTI